MAGTWVPYTNQKIYLARLQLDLTGAEPARSQPPLKESAREAGILFTYAAWQGLLNEIAESSKLKDRVDSLSDLEKTLGASNSEVSMLLALYEDPRSWLRLLLREYDACLRPQLKTNAAQSAEQVLIATGEEGPQRYQLILKDLKEYISAFRDRSQEW